MTQRQPHPDNLNLGNCCKIKNKEMAKCLKRKRLFWQQRKACASLCKTKKGSNGQAKASSLTCQGDSYKENLWKERNVSAKLKK